MSSIKQQFESKLPNGIKVNSSNKPILSNQYLKKLKLTQPVGVVFYISPLKKSINSLTEFLKIKVIDAIISGMRYPSGLLHSRLRGQELVYVVHTAHLKLANNHMLFTYALTSPKHVATTSKIIRQSLVDTQDITDAEFKSAKTQVLFNFQDMAQNIQSQTTQLLLFDQLFGELYSDTAITQTLNGISIYDVQDYINQNIPNQFILKINQSP